MADDPGFRIEPGLRPAHRAAAVAGYWQAFARKLRVPLGPQEKARAFIDRVLDPAHAISAVSEAGGFLGCAGFKTAKGAFVGGGLGDLRAIYGLGLIWRLPILSVLERAVEPDVLLMDGIFVAPDARGSGVGSALLTAIEDHARGAGLGRIRLDVIDTNPRARALYERRGFRAGKTARLGPLSALFGFSSSLTMTKDLTAGAEGAARADDPGG